MSREYGSGSATGIGRSSGSAGCCCCYWGGLTETYMLLMTVLGKNNFLLRFRIRLYMLLFALVFIFSAIRICVAYHYTHTLVLEYFFCSIFVTCYLGLRTPICANFDVAVSIPTQEYFFCSICEWVCEAQELLLQFLRFVSPPPFFDWC